MWDDGKDGITAGVAAELLSSSASPSRFIESWGAACTAAAEVLTLASADRAWEVMIFVSHAAGVPWG